MQIGQYNEEALSNIPPVGLYSVDDSSSVVLASSQMAAILDEGWDEEEEEHLEEDREMMAQAVQYSPRGPALPVGLSYFRVRALKCCNRCLESTACL